MKFRELPLHGVFVLDAEPSVDERGSFTRTFCVDEFVAHASRAAAWRSRSASVSARRGTLRGMHLQLAPREETKVVRCTRGAIFDVVVDLRAGSPTLGGWFGLDLPAASGRAVYVPAGCAHGFLVLEDDTEVEYLIRLRTRPQHAVASAGTIPRSASGGLSTPPSSRSRTGRSRTSISPPSGLRASKRCGDVRSRRPPCGRRTPRPTPSRRCTRHRGAASARGMSSRRTSSGTAARRTASG